MTNSQSVSPNKIYVVLVGCAPMASRDALKITLDRFKSILSSDSAKERFETTLRTIKTSLREIDQFIDQVYQEKNPIVSVTTNNRTFIVELALTKNEFLANIDNDKVQEILTKIKSIGTMPAKKLPNQTMREYTAFPFTYGKDA